MAMTHEAEEAVEAVVCGRRNGSGKLCLSLILRGEKRLATAGACHGTDRNEAGASRRWR